MKKNMSIKKDKNEKYDTIQLMEKKIRYLLGSRIRRKDQILAAVKNQQMIRERHSVYKDWDSVVEIRKWREKK
jgi:hypothetical protein